MQNIPDPASVSSVHPQSFKTQLKKLSGTTTHRKAFKTGNVLDAVAVNNKGAEVKPQASKAKRFAGEEVQENVSDSVQNDAINNAESVTHSSNSVHIASLSTDELSDKARTYNTSFESQADTIVSQVSIATPVSTSVASATPSFSLAGMGAGLGALALGGSSGGSSGGGAQTTAVTTTPKSDTPLALSGFIAAGPMVNNDGLKVEVFDVNGNRLASTNSVKDGTFTINLKNTYTGILKVVVSDTNGEAINFIDEANGKSKSLGTDLITIFNLLAGEKNLNINVNTLTTEAANKVLTVSNDLTKVTNADISKANLEIATKYGLIDKSSQAAINPDLLITSKPGLIIDLTGAINQGFNAYGLALAVKSVLDDNPSMTIKDACKSLAENPLYTKSFGGPTDWASAVYKFGASFLDNVLPTGSSTITVANDQPISQTTTITQGQVLRATSSITDIDGIPTSGTGALSYKWQASSDKTNWSDSDIVDATGNTFTTTQAQVGKFIRAVATYTDNFGTTETVESAPTNSIVNIDDATTGALTISGSANQGQVLTATSTIADIDGIPASGAGALSYKWQASSDKTNWSDSDIAGATASTFTTTQAQVGKFIRVVATYTDNFGTPEEVTSAPTTTAITNANDAPSGALTISGIANQGQVLTATSTIADIDGIPASGAGALTYKWQASSVSGGSWSDIAGATASTFTTTQAQVGKYIRAVATYTDNFGTTETVESAPTDAITYKYEVDPLLIEGTSTVAPASQTGSTQSFAAGDVNGDGISDWIYAIGGPEAGTTPTLMKREMYVMFGDTSGTYVLNTANADKGFRIQLHSLTGIRSAYSAFGNNLGYLPSIATDFNGDGKSEIIVGIHVDEPYKTHLTLVDQANRDPDANQVLIRLVNFDHPSSAAGYRASVSGDINGDGFSDLIIGNRARQNVNVLYGTKNIYSVNYNYNAIAPDNVLPANFGFNIFDSQQKIDLSFGWAVSASGDVNGDGYGDIAIANSYSDDPTLQTEEEVFVIFGKPGSSNANIDVNSIRSGTGNTQGYVISMDPQLPFLAFNMSATATKVAGDFNGDGLNDFVFEGRSYDHTAAKFYVVFGKQSTSKIGLDRLGTNGFSISLPTAALRDVIFIEPTLDDYFGDMPRHTAANCGDFNGDGIDDMLISLIFNTRLSDTEKTNHFLSYVVYGKTELGDIDLNDLGNNGFKVFEGTRTLPTRSEFFGNVVPVGDINADGLPDLVFDDYFGTQGGTPTVIFGSSIDQPQPQWKVTHQGFDGSDTLTSSGVNQSETFIAGAGQDTVWGKGGADVMYAGAGNDVFYLNADNINKLSTPMQNNERLARVDGGGGLDTLALDGSYINVDLTAIANTRLQSIEKINLGGNNKLKLSWQDIQNMSAMNLFNDATSGWSGFSSNTIRHHQLLIDGSATDSVDFLTEGGWVKEPTTVQLNNGESIQNYNLYTNTNHATQLLVNTSVGTVI
jgi:hypothetical protein